MEAVLFQFSSRKPMQRLRRVGGDRLVLGTTVLVQVVAWCFAAIALAALVHPQRERHIIWIALFGFLALSLGYFPSRAVFDRRTGELTFRRGFSRRRFPLAAISNVKISDGGWHYPRRGYGRPYRTTELKLVLEDEDCRPLLLMNHSNHVLTKTMAAEIAKFLGLSLLDEAQLAPDLEGLPGPSPMSEERHALDS